MMAMEHGVAKGNDKVLRDVIRVMIMVVKESPLGDKLRAAKTIQ